MTEAEKYVQLAEYYRQPKEQAVDREARVLLNRLEDSYRILAKSYAVLDRSLQLQQKMGPRG